MTRNIKYGIGEKVSVLFVSDLKDNENMPVLVDQKLGIVHQVKSLDPRMTFFIPIGPKPLPFAAQE